LQWGYLEFLVDADELGIHIILSKVQLELMSPAEHSIELMHDSKARCSNFQSGVTTTKIVLQVASVDTPAVT